MNARVGTWRRPLRRQAPSRRRGRPRGGPVERHFLGVVEECQVRLAIVHQLKRERPRLLADEKHELHLWQCDNDTLQRCEVLLQLGTVHPMRARGAEVDAEKAVVLPQGPDQGRVSLQHIHAVLAAQVCRKVDGGKLPGLLAPVDLLLQLAEPRQGGVARLLALLLGAKVDAPLHERELLRDVTQCPGRDRVVHTAEREERELESAEGVALCQRRRRPRRAKRGAACGATAAPCAT
mmetsp:Transcript_9620/g.24826  ORF Transcript_9620/g.24826 Transcript_9620/m.24826 type:complete len:236 (-) Transcript_9620:557-1264(-)